MHKAGGATTNPVGIFFCETFHSRNDETTLRGVIWHVGSNKTPPTCQILCLLESEAVFAHQHFDAPVSLQAVDHANAWQVITNPLAHADAVSPLVALRWLLQVVVDAVQTPNKHVVGLGTIGG